MIHEIQKSDSEYPAGLIARFGDCAPGKLNAIGDLNLLDLPMTAIFCSTRCPGDAILRAYDRAAKWRDEGRCVISGFHSPVEKECLRILLRGNQPIIICPARSLIKMRIPTELKRALAGNRLLILSFFSDKAHRATAESAQRRNEFVAALADENWFAHISPGGQMERIALQVEKWGSRLSHEL
ncbi:MAG TPA: DNA-binding protein [Verrucomicrobiae bacterium]|nr:DNA-binding protein [Verrucomicrobiae bacterium]